MGVRVTTRDTDKVAIFDSVTETAFGPLFPNVEAADDFLAWLQREDGRDARQLTSQELESIWNRWWDVRGASLNW